MEITIDINKRIEWLKKRITISSIDEDYIRLQMQELVIESIKELYLSLESNDRLKDGVVVKKHKYRIIK